jgi:hypothetical protein
MKTLTIYPSALLMASLLAACGGGQPQTGLPPTPDQDALCSTSAFSSAQTAAICKAGQKVIYIAPAGSQDPQQLGVMFAAGHCDYRYQVVMGGNSVSCIFKPLSASATATTGPAKQP